MTAPTAAKPPLSQKIRAAITRHATELAEAPELSELFWLCDPEDGNQTQDDYCAECAPIVVALGPLVFCHLALLNGEALPAAVHNFTEADGSHSIRCLTCDIWESNADLAPCWTMPRQAVEWAQAAVDGGWTRESDSWRTCENCGKELRVLLTDYGVDEEMKHWQHSGPPDCGSSWWEFSRMLERLTDRSEHWQTIGALFEKWGLLAELWR